MKACWGNGWRGIVALALLFVAGVARAQTPQEVSGASPEAQAPVVRVRIVSEEGRVLSEAPAGLSIEIGKPLDRSKVAESLRALYGTGDYAELRAVAWRVEGGVRLDFVARENLFFNQVRIEGLTPAVLTLLASRVRRGSAVSQSASRQMPAGVSA